MGDKVPLKYRLLARLAGGGEMVGKLTAVWAWLNGKKTALGAVIIAVGFLLDWLPTALPAFGVDPALSTKIVGVVAIVGGLLHKLWKARFNQPAPGDPIR